MSTHKILSEECWCMNCHVVRSNLQPRLNNVHISIHFQFNSIGPRDKPGFHPAWCSPRSRKGSGMWACCTWPPRTAAPAPCGPSPPAPLSLSRRRSSAGRGQAHRGLSDFEGLSWTSGGNDSTLAWIKTPFWYFMSMSVSALMAVLSYIRMFKIICLRFKMWNILQNTSSKLDSWK